MATGAECAQSEGTRGQGRAHVTHEAAIQEGGRRVQGLGSHLQGRKASPGGKGHSQWLQLRPVSPARGACMCSELPRHILKLPLHI